MTDLISNADISSMKDPSSRYQLCERRIENSDHTLKNLLVAQQKLVQGRNKSTAVQEVVRHEMDVLRMHWREHDQYTDRRIDELSLEQSSGERQIRRMLETLTLVHETCERAEVRCFALVEIFGVRTTCSVGKYDILIADALAGEADQARGDLPRAEGRQR